MKSRAFKILYIYVRQNRERLYTMGMMSDRIYNFEGVAEANRLANPNGVHKLGWLTVCNAIEMGCNYVASAAGSSIFGSFNSILDDIACGDGGDADVVENKSIISDARAAAKRFEDNPTAANAAALEKICKETDNKTVARIYKRYRDEIASAKQSK